MSTPRTSPTIRHLSVAAAGLAVAVALIGVGVAPATAAAPAPVATSSASDQTAVSGSAPADGPSPRRSSYVGGGYWEYGTTGSTVYSTYQHASRQHSATACAKNDKCAYSGWRAPSYLAVASRAKSSGGNTAFWNVR